MATHLDTIDEHFMKVHAEGASRPALSTRQPGCNAQSHIATSQGPMKTKNSNILIENVCRAGCSNDHETELLLNFQRNEDNINKENAGAMQNLDRAQYSQTFVYGENHMRQRSCLVDGMSAVEEEQNDVTSYGEKTEQTTSN